MNSKNNEEYTEEDSIESLVMNITSRFSRIQITDIMIALGYKTDDRGTSIRIGNILTNKYKWKKDRITPPDGVRGTYHFNPNKELNGRKLEPYHSNPERTL